MLLIRSNCHENMQGVLGVSVAVTVDYSVFFSNTFIAMMPFLFLE